MPRPDDRLMTRKARASHPGFAGHGKCALALAGLAFTRPNYDREPCQRLQSLLPSMPVCTYRTDAIRPTPREARRASSHIPQRPAARPRDRRRATAGHCQEAGPWETGLGPHGVRSPLTFGGCSFSLRDHRGEPVDQRERGSFLRGPGIAGGLGTRRVLFSELKRMFEHMRQRDVSIASIKKRESGVTLQVTS
jgi:hypothetical protein